MAHLRSSLARTGAALVLWLVAVGAAGATVLHVPADHPTIAAALAVATAGDAVAVAPGTYHEANLVLPAGASLYGEGAWPGNVVIDGGGAARVLTITGGDETTIVENLTLTGGDAHGAGDARLGGALLCRDASPDLRFLVIRGNVADLGGGVFVRGGAPVLSNCRLQENVSRTAGGGLYAVDEATPVLADCLIADNQAGIGGAWYAARGAVPAFARCTIAYNASADVEAAAFLTAPASLERCLVAHHVVVPDAAFGVGTVPDYTCGVRWAAGDPEPFVPQVQDGSIVAADPLLCLNGDPLQQPDLFFGLAGDSPCLPASSGGCYLIGAYPQACDVPTGSPERLPAACVLQTIAPNPFNPSTTIRFALRDAGRVRLDVYGLTGRRIATLVAGELPAGPHAVTWRGADDRGRPVASGVYLCRLTAGGASLSRRLTLVR